jgi:tRNA(fMet)-specific endonuclease VapC
MLDTTVLVTAERHGAALDQVIADEDDVAIAAITAAELLVGVELADSLHVSRRAAFVDAVLGLVPVESYDLDVARVHARLLAHARGAGRPRGAHDLIIAATALSSGRAVVTADSSGFEDLPGLDVVATPGLGASS